jgi:hypothetical protein
MSWKVFFLGGWIGSGARAETGEEEEAGLGERVVSLELLEERWRTARKQVGSQGKV